MPSDLNGNYVITLDKASTAILVFTFVGYKPQEIPVAGRSVIDVKMETEVSKLNEVVVTALGIPREVKSLGYARQSVDVEKMTEARDPNNTNMLAGKVAGLQVTTSVQPTGSTRVILRGVNSLSGNNQPLWVVDGVPIDNSQGQIGDLDYGNGAADLNPDDILSIEVLKGPNAAALYGSRAANGAIIVTTKKGNDTGDGAVGVSFNSNFMVGTVYEYPAYQNIYGEGNTNRLNINNIDRNSRAFVGGSFGFSYGAPMLGQPYQTYDGTLRTYVPQPGNVKDLYRSSYRATQNISISKADKTSSLRLSYTFANGNDIIEKQNLDNKHTVSFAASKDFKSFLKVETRAQFTTQSVKNRTYRNLNANSPMTANVYFVRSVAIDDLNPWKDVNGRAFGIPITGYENPYWSINENFNKDDDNRFIGGVTGTVTLTKHIKFRGQISADLLNGNGFTFLDRDGIIAPNGSSANFTQNNKIYNTEGLFMYSKAFSKFSLTANAGGNLRSQNYYRTTTSTQTLAAQDVMNISNAGGFVFNTDLLTRAKVNSLYGTATLGYRGYAYLDVTARNDWSSTVKDPFFYPSISGSFIVSEAFKLPKVFTYAKLRASVASVGNDSDPYNLVNGFNYAGNFNGNAFVSYDNVLRNPNLKPERTNSAEVGVELKLLKGRLTFDGTGYKSASINQIFRSQVASERGFFFQVFNAGEIQNKGVELTMTAELIKTKNIAWTITTNYSANRNKVVSLVPGVDRFPLGSASEVSINAQVGQPIGNILGEAQYRASTGEVILQSNGLPFTEPLSKLGNFLPDWLGALGSNIRYKAFDLSFNFGIKMGGEIFSASNARANIQGNTLSSVAGREDNILSGLILGETLNELKGLTTLYNLPYPDAERAKGLKFDGYYAKLGLDGLPLLDKNGRMQPVKRLIII